MADVACVSIKFIVTSLCEFKLLFKKSIERLLDSFVIVLKLLQWASFVITVFRGDNESIFSMTTI